MVTRWQLFWNACSFGLVTFVLASFNAIVLPLSFPALFKEISWTVSKEMVMMLWKLITVTAGNIILAHYFYHVPLSFHYAIGYLWVTLAVGVFPITFITLLKQKLLLKKYAPEAEEIDDALDGNVPNPPSDETDLTEPVTLYSENKKENFTIQAAFVRYIASADNYIRIYYIVQGKSDSRLLRGSLRKAEETLVAIPVFFRCHRAYIVNLSAVIHVSGNAQGYKLHLAGTDDIVPVSRNLSASLKEKLMTLHISPR